MAFGFGEAGCGCYPFYPVFILFLILILMCFGMFFIGGCGCGGFYGEQK